MKTILKCLNMYESFQGVKNGFKNICDSVKRKHNCR